MIWDPWLGWDWIGVRNLAIYVILANLFISFIAVTEGEAWYYLYEMAFDAMVEHSAAVLILLIIAVTAAYSYWRYQIW